jgi:hypothetical protein
MGHVRLERHGAAQLRDGFARRTLRGQRQSQFRRRSRRARLRRRQRRQHATRLVQSPQRAQRLAFDQHCMGMAGHRPQDFAGLGQGQRRLSGQQAGGMAQRGLDRAAGRRPNGGLASALGLLRCIRPALAGPLICHHSSRHPCLSEGKHATPARLRNCEQHNPAPAARHGAICDARS